MTRSWPKLSHWLVAELRLRLNPAQHLFPFTLSTLNAHSWGLHRFLVLSCKWPFVPSSCVGSAFPYSTSDYSKSLPLKPFWPSFNPIPPPNPQSHLVHNRYSTTKWTNPSFSSREKHYPRRFWVLLWLIACESLYLVLCVWSSFIPNCFLVLHSPNTMSMCCNVNY